MSFKKEVYNLLASPLAQLTHMKMVGTVGFEPTVDDLLSPTTDSKSATLPGYVNAPIENTEDAAASYCFLMITSVLAQLSSFPRSITPRCWIRIDGVPRP